MGIIDTQSLDIIIDAFLKIEIGQLQLVLFIFLVKQDMSQRD